jgi:hypothetical protein
MANLLQETNEILKENKKSWQEVKWVGCRDFQIPIALFKDLANKEYDDGYGAQEVATDLLVVGNNWWLERHEYDGSEWWEFKELPKEPIIYRPDIKKIIGEVWKTLEELNDKEESNNG